MRTDFAVKPADCDCGAEWHLNQTVVGGGYWQHSKTCTYVITLENDPEIQALIKRLITDPYSEMMARWKADA